MTLTTFLWLQGSTCVYSRKVEHVYQLVLRTIEFLTEQRQQKQAGASKGPKNGDSDDTGGEVRLAVAHVKSQKQRSLGDGV